MTRIVVAATLLVASVAIAGTTAVHEGELSAGGLTMRTSTRTDVGGSAFPASSARASATWCGAASPIDRAPNAIAGNPVHWVYAVPSDGQDRLSSLATVMQSNAEEIDAWWRTQDTTRLPRNDLTQFPCGLQLDITTVRLPQSGVQLESLNGRFTAVFNALAAAGLRSLFTKYLVYYDGPVAEGNVCGQGGSDPSGFGLAVVYYQACTGVSIAAVAVHEVVHTLGAVPRGAPNECSGENSGHTCDTVTDLLHPSIGDESLSAKTLDPGRDDYYGHAGAWPDAQDSPWLVRLDNQAPFALSISGPGSVSTDVPGLQCAQSCSTTWNSGTRLAFTATPNPGARLVRWGAACVGSAGCTVTVGPGSSLSALFAPATFRLTVRVSGQGAVRSSRSGITCRPRCSATFPSYSPVTLTAKPAKGLKFLSWSGACRGSKRSCTVPMTAATSVRAVFVRA